MVLLGGRWELWMAKISNNDDFTTVKSIRYRTHLSIHLSCARNRFVQIKEKKLESFRVFLIK